MAPSATTNGTHIGDDVTLIIDGVSRPSSTGTTYAVHNPLTGKFLHNAHSASAEDCRAAVESAQAAFKEWKEWTPSRRRMLFYKAADLFETPEWQAKIKERMSSETGANSNWIHPANTLGAAANLREVGAQVTHIKGEVIPSDFPGTTVMLIRDPVGVVFAVAPWNAPITLSLRAIATPLICGNTVILKASEYSPLTQRTVVEAFMEAGIPKGVLNFLMFSTQDAPARTEEIIGMRPVRRINFTGSDRVGRKVAEICGRHLKQGIFELGGKAAAVVLDDADLDSAADKIVFAGLMHGGQICMSTERVICSDKIADTLGEKLVERMKSLTAGPENEGHKLPCLFRESAAKGVIEMLEDAVQKGGKLLLGDLKRHGSIIQPHLIDQCPPNSKLYLEESFGPVIIICRVNEGIQAMIDLVNSSEYTLTNSVYGTNIEDCMNVAKSMRSGSAHINGPSVSVETNRPAGGLGGPSGYGRFGGSEGVNGFTDLRIITINRQKDGLRPPASDRTTEIQG